MKVQSHERCIELPFFQKFPTSYDSENAENVWQFWRRMNGANSDSATSDKISGSICILQAEFVFLPTRYKMLMIQYTYKMILF